MSAFSFYFKVIQALEEIEAPYMIVGAFKLADKHGCFYGHGHDHSKLPGMPLSGW